MSFRELLLFFTVMIWGFCFATIVVPINTFNQEIKDKIAAAQQDLEAKEETIRRQTEEYQALRNNDPVIIEKVLREKYGYCKDNDTVIIFNKTTAKSN